MAALPEKSPAEYSTSKPSTSGASGLLDVEPSRLTSGMLRFSTLILDAVPIGLVDEDAASKVTPAELQLLQRQQATCRTLIAMFSMDSLCWGCYKAMEFEALEAGRRAHQMDKASFPLRCAPDSASEHHVRRAHSLSRASPDVHPLRPSSHPPTSPRHAPVAHARRCGSPCVVAARWT